MKVKLQTVLCGPGGNAGQGDVIEVTDSTGKHLIDTGQAVASSKPATKEVELADQAAADKRFKDKEAAERRGA